MNKLQFILRISDSLDIDPGTTYVSLPDLGNPPCIKGSTIMLFTFSGLLLGVE